jgi:hypothetical protein
MQEAEEERRGLLLHSWLELWQPFPEMGRSNGGPGLGIK